MKHTNGKTKPIYPHKRREYKNNMILNFKSATLNINIEIDVGFALIHCMEEMGYAWFLEPYLSVVFVLCIL